MATKKWGVAAVIILFGTSNLLAVGNLPIIGSKKKQQPPPAAPQTQIQYISPEEKKFEDINKDIDVTDDELFELRNQYRKALQQKRFVDAMTILQKIPFKEWSKTDKDNYLTFKIFDRVETEFSEESSVFEKEEELEAGIQAMIKKLYRESQSAIVEGKMEPARDLLIHIVYLHRRNFRAKKLLELTFDLKTGSYKVENMENRYWNNSSTHFYGGNYAEAVQDLEVLALFDHENPDIYERLGSSYYMMGEKQKAIDAWNSALFFKPGNKQLQDVVSKTKVLLEEEKQEQILREQARKEIRGGPEIKKENLQMLGVFPTRDKAYTYAKDLRTQGFTVVVEEQENGRWAVMVPKSQMTGKKGK